MDPYIDKYEMLEMIEQYLKDDDHCSRHCPGCKYEKVCNKMGEENILERLFEE